MDIDLRPGSDDDIEWLVELRADVLRADLERLGRFDAVRVRQRMRDGFDARRTRIIVADGADVGSVTLRPEGAVIWIEHFYIAPASQRRGLGGRVLAQLLDEIGSTTARLNVLQGSGARRLYERHGFVVDAEDAVDVFMTRGVLQAPSIRQSRPTA